MRVCSARPASDKAYINVVVTSNGEVNLVLVKHILQSGPQVIGNACHAGERATAAGGCVYGAVEVDNQPGGDAPVDGCQVINDKPAVQCIML